MARVVTPLNDTKIKTSKPTEKNYTLSDGKGLQLLIKPNGTKLWEFYYTSPATLKRRKTSFGVYPSVSLVNARKKRTEYQELINNSIDPIDHFKEIKEQIKEKRKQEDHTIGNIIEQYFDFRKDELSESTIKKDKSRIKFSFVDRLKKGDDTNIHTLDFDTIKNTLQYLEDENKLETLKKVKGIIIRLLKFVFKRDITDTAELIGKLELYEFKRQSKKQVRNNPTLTDEKDIKTLYNDILHYDHNTITRYLLILT